MTLHKDIKVPLINSNLARQRPNLPVKVIGNDRPLKLTQRNPNPKNSPGLIGREVFTGANKLHALYDESTGLWKFKLDHGVLPEVLRQQFTSFIALMKHAKTYFNNKDIDIVEDALSHTPATGMQNKIHA